MAIELTDDGTMDTVLRCDECGREYRYNFGNTDAWDCPHDTHGDVCEDCYDDFIDECITELTEEHECSAEEE